MNDFPRQPDADDRTQREAVVDCAIVEQWIQTYLDGESTTPPAIDWHLRDCASCRSRLRASERLIGALPLLPRPASPPAFAHHLALAVQADRRRRQRQRRAVVGVALAASVMMLALGGWMLARPDQPQWAKADGSWLISLPIKDAEPSLRQQLSEARSAVVAMTTRAADDSVPTLPMPMEVTEVALGNPLTPFERSTTLEPAVQSLDEAAQGASVAFQPVTTAASRAFGFLYRELPSVPVEPKPEY